MIEVGWVHESSIATKRMHRHLRYAIKEHSPTPFRKFYYYNTCICTNLAYPYPYPGHNHIHHHDYHEFVVIGLTIYVI